ncbi:MAG: YraN family protein [bacterium]|nr:YraN family protein [bacterium]
MSQNLNLKREWKAVEVLADFWLRKQGLICIARNLKLTKGEIDWLGWENNSLVIIEVKASCVNPFIASNRVDKKKKLKLISCVQELLTNPEYKKADEVKIELLLALLKNNTWCFERIPIDFHDVEENCL